MSDMRPQKLIMTETLAEDIAKKHELLREIHQGDIKIQKLEKEHDAFLGNKRSDIRKDYEILEEIQSSQSESRKKDGNRLNQHRLKIRALVKKFREEVKAVTPTPQFVETVKKKMEEIETSITEFRENQRTIFEELMKAELGLWQESLLLERKIDAWAAGNEADDLGPGPGGHGHTRPTLASARDVTKDLPLEVAAMERFLDQTGGRTGGWSEYDHQTFLRVRQRHKGKASFVREASSLLVTRSPGEVEEHEAWYQDFLRHNDNKKAAIQRWRENKKAERERGHGDGASTSDEEGDEDDPNDGTDWERRKKKMEARRAQLDSWRAEREVEKWKAKEEEERRKAEERKREAERRRRKQDAAKSKVEAFRAQKEQEDLERAAMDLLAEAREREVRHRDVELHSARIQERNSRLVESKLQRKRLKELEDKEKEERLERLKAQVEVIVPRDPRRLLQPTAGWQQRVNQIAEGGADGGSSGGSAAHIPRRAVPSWRQGLS